MVELKVSRFGNSLGIILPKEVIDRLHTADGGRLFLTETPDGGYLLKPHNPDFEKKTAMATDIISRYGNMLHRLSK